MIKIDLRSTTERKSRNQVRNIRRKLEKASGEKINIIKCIEYPKGIFTIQGELFYYNLKNNTKKAFIFASWKDISKIHEEIYLVAHNIKNNIEG